MPFRVAVTRKLPDLGEQMLTEAERRGEIQVTRWPNELPPFPQELAKLIRGADGVISLLTEPMTVEVFEREPQLQVVSNLAVGFDNIDVPAATRYKVAVCNTPGVLTDATADMAFTLLMATARRVQEAVDYVRDGKWETMVADASARAGDHRRDAWCHRLRPDRQGDGPARHRLPDAVARL